MFWYKPYIKVAGWNQIPLIFNKDIQSPSYNPYRRKSTPGDGYGFKMNLIGNDDQSGESSGGPSTRFRNVDSPRYISEFNQDIDDPVNLSNINDMEDTNIDHAPSDGANGTRFFAPEDPLGKPYEVTTEQPVGPHNMQTHGKYRQYKRHVDNIFEFLAKK